MSHNNSPRNLCEKGVELAKRREKKFWFQNLLELHNRQNALNAPSEYSCILDALLYGSLPDTIR